TAMVVRLVLILTGLTCFAQDSRVQTLTIEQAVSEATDRNLTILAEKYNISVAQARVVTAALRPNPVLTVEGDHLDLLGTGFNKENGAGPEEYSVRTDFVFERGGKRERRIDAARAAVSTAELQFLNTIRSVVLDVESSFVDLLQAKADLA